MQKYPFSLKTLNCEKVGIQNTGFHRIINQRKIKRTLENIKLTQRLIRKINGVLTSTSVNG